MLCGGLYKMLQIKCAAKQTLTMSFILLLQVDQSQMVSVSNHNWYLLFWLVGKATCSFTAIDCHGAGGVWSIQASAACLQLVPVVFAAYRQQWRYSQSNIVLDKQCIWLERSKPSILCIQGAPLFDLPLDLLCCRWSCHLCLTTMLLGPHGRMYLLLLRNFIRYQLQMYLLYQKACWVVRNCSMHRCTCTFCFWQSAEWFT